MTSADDNKERRDAEPPCLWVQGRCLPEVEASLDRDLATLREAIDFRRLAAAHPLRALWSAPFSDARFELHHLADDIRITRQVPGFAGLLKMLLRGADTYEDYRYELRIAGAIGRSGEQRIVKLAGEAIGPDIEVVTKSGHTCGVACYRANSATPDVTDASRHARTLVESFAAGASKGAPFGRVALEVVFASLPVKGEHVAEATLGLRDALSDLQRPEFERTGVKVRRVAHTPGDARDFFLRFLFPVPAREAYRLDAHVREKIHKENKWARSFGGIALLAMEQPALGLDLTASELGPLLSTASTGIAMALTSRAFFPRGEGVVPHKMESIHPVAHESVGAMKFKLGLETFGDNGDSWAEGHPYAEYIPEHAWEEWDVRVTGDSVVSTRRLPLTLVQQRMRIPLEPNETPRSPSFVQRVAAGAVKMRDALGLPLYDQS